MTNPVRDPKLGAPGGDANEGRVSLDYMVETARTASDNETREKLNEALASTQAEQKRRAEEEQRRIEEAHRIDEERRAEEAHRIEEERRAEEQRRIDEERRAEEQRRIDEERRAAMARAQRWFSAHVAAYAVAAAFAFVLNDKLIGGVWPYWLLIAWGLGLAGHAIVLMRARGKQPAA